jgi:hypothetical protein
MGLIGAALLFLSNLLIATPVLGADEKELNQVLITNVDVWDGRSSGVSKGLNVAGKKQPCH